METTDITRKLKIFCPTHQSVFEISESAKVVCEIKEHALSNDFPQGEFWEYCCDCQTFSPSSLEVGGKAKTDCPHCERAALNRFVCGNCKTVSYDSGEDTKGKIFRVDFSLKTVEPSCAGCLKDFAGADLKLHKCEEAQAIFLTSRKDCPFCKKEVAPPVKKKAVAQNLPTQNVAKVGTSVAKTKLLGSICPTCGAASEPDSVFCANCGQTLKVATPPPLPPNMPPIPIEVANPTVVDNVKPATSAKSSNTNGCLIAVGVLFGVIVLCVIFQGLLSTKNPTTSTTSSTSITSNYRGTIGVKSVSISMTLTREGSSLTGKASTNQTDFLRGTIENNGNFVLNAYSGDNIQTGIYRGKINSDGSISGTWTNPNGGQGTSFYLTKY